MARSPLFLTFIVLSLVFALGIAVVHHANSKGQNLFAPVPGISAIQEK